MNSSSSSAHSYSGSHSFAGTPMSVSICDTDQKLSEHTDLDFTWRIAGVNFRRFLRRSNSLFLTACSVSLPFSTWRLSPRNGQPLGSISLSRDSKLMVACLELRGGLTTGFAVDSCVGQLARCASTSSHAAAWPAAISSAVMRVACSSSARLFLAKALAFTAQHQWRWTIKVSQQCNCTKARACGHRDMSLFSSKYRLSIPIASSSHA